MTKPILTIVRGLPGSGKSTYARKLHRDGAMLIEPDALLVRGGVYEYSPTRYLWATKSAFRMLSWGVNMGSDVVYADVLPTVDDLKELLRVDVEHNYTIRVIDMPLLTVDESMARNRHNVHREDIERMAREWEPWEGQK